MFFRKNFLADSKMTVVTLSDSKYDLSKHNTVLPVHSVKAYGGVDV